MTKPEWGTKRTCPKCGARFYDLGNADPVICIECAEEWVPEPILKSKQLSVEVEKEEKSDEKSDDLLKGISDDDDDDIDLDDDDDDDALIADISLDDDEDVEVTSMVDKKLTDDE